MKDWTAEATFLIVPGWNGSGPGHWQTILEQRHHNFFRIEQEDWHRPSRREWMDAIERAVQKTAAPVFLVAHSLGCLAVAHWATSKKSSSIDGALLAAPPWLTLSDSCPAELADFLPMPLNTLPFPSILAASQDDPYLPVELAIRLARAWGSEFADVGPEGHINVASGRGDWPEGHRLLERLTRRALEKVNDGAVAKR